MLVQAGIDESTETKWRWMKMACGENPVYIEMVLKRKYFFTHLFVEKLLWKTWTYAKNTYV